MMSNNPNWYVCNDCCSTPALYTDLDVMFSSVTNWAYFSGQGNILVEPFVSETEGFSGYATLSALVPGLEGRCVSSKIFRDQAEQAVGDASIANIPGVSCCYQCAPKLKLGSKGPAMKISITPGLFEADITPCFYCPEWPTISDWPSRQRYWPSLADAQKIMSLGCHLVAKPAPDDEDKTRQDKTSSL